MRLPQAITTALGTALVLTACAAGTAPAPEPSAETEPPVAESEAPAETETAGETDADADGSETAGTPVDPELSEWLLNAQWSFDNGLEDPLLVTLADGHATDEHGRTYEMGLAMASDANGDGLTDLIAAISQLDGNGFQEMWFVWMGTGSSESAPLTQVKYPIAQAARCGNVIHGVTPSETGFQITESLWLQHVDAFNDCATGASGHHIRDVSIVEVDGEFYPMQTDPVPAWGGVCPQPRELSGISAADVTGRAAPARGAPEVIVPGDEVLLFDVPQPPLLTSGGATVTGFLPATDMTADDAPLVTACAFTG